jgi:ribonuclease BN (tRNA processing enzyme)
MDSSILYSRAGIATQILLSTEEYYFIVDAGDGTLRDLVSLKINFQKIRGIFLTHGHYDHIGGLYALLGHFRVIERKEKIDIYFPKGCKEVQQIVFAFKENYDDFSFKIQTHEVKGGSEVKIENIEVKIYQMRHYAAVVAISGDTGMCSGLIELVRGADVAYIDSTLKEEEVTDTILNNLHLSQKKAEEIGRFAKKYIPIHLQGDEEN